MNPIVRQIFLTTLPSAIRGCVETSHSCAQGLWRASEDLNASGSELNENGTAGVRGHDHLPDQGADARFRARDGSLSKRKVAIGQSLSARSRLLSALGARLSAGARCEGRTRGLERRFRYFAGQTFYAFLAGLKRPGKSHDRCSQTAPEGSS